MAGEGKTGSWRRGSCDLGEDRRERLQWGKKVPYPDSSEKAEGERKPVRQSW